MKLPRSGVVSKIVVCAVILYAGVNLVTLRGRIETARAERDTVKHKVDTKEITNAELEYEIEHHDEPEVIAEIARTDLGLVLQGEIVFYEGSSEVVD